MQELITRQQARDKGLAKYFTGVPCRAGHAATRLVSSKQCDECKRELQRKPQYRSKATARVDRTVAAETNKRSRLKHLDKRKSERRKYYHANVEAEKASTKKWRQENPHKGRLYNANRKARLLRATPAWLSQSQLTAIELIYKNCPKGFHVDHRAPLAGKTVCGLHVPWNLQMLTAEDNETKKNKLTEAARPACFD